MPTYSYVSPNPGVYKPWIKVRLGNKKNHKITPSSIYALIDSGADVCFCSTDIGRWLQIPLNKHQDSFTAANNTQFKAFKTTVELQACGKTYSCPFYFTDDLPKIAPIILGQKGFFDHFEITFNLIDREIKTI